jgi:hypothetical protein
MAESLESRCLLSLTAINPEVAIPFKRIVVDQNSGTTPYVRQPVDITKVGDNDAVVGPSTVLNSIGGITGTLVVDPLGGGVTDPDDPAKAPAGQQVYLDLQNSGQFVTGDPTTTTDANGDYSFTNLANGTYTVRFVPYTGYSQNYPVNGGGQTVTVDGQTVENVVLGEVEGFTTVSPFSVEIRSKLPAALVGGDKATVKLRVTNTEGIPLRPLDLNLYLSASNTLGPGAQPVVNSALYAVLRPGHTDYRLQFTVPDALQAGSYYLLASMVDENTIGIAPPTITASATTIACSPPVVSFDATLADQNPVATEPGRKQFAIVDVTNTGNISAASDITIDLYASSTAAPDDGTLLESFDAHIRAEPSHSHRYRIVFVPPAGLSAGDYYLSAKVSRKEA